MSDYVSYDSIRFRNELLTPQVLNLYRQGNLNLQSIQGTIDPMLEIYKDTYSYLEYDSLSERAKKLLYNTLHGKGDKCNCEMDNPSQLLPPNVGKINKSTPIGNNNQISFPPYSVPSAGYYDGLTTYGPMVSKDITNYQNCQNNSCQQFQPRDTGINYSSSY